MRFEPPFVPASVSLRDHIRIGRLTPQNVAVLLEFAIGEGSTMFGRTSA